MAEGFGPECAPGSSSVPGRNTLCHPLIPNHNCHALGHHRPHCTWPQTSCSRTETSMMAATENAPLMGSEPQDDGVDSHTQEMASWRRRPWWKRPSPYWIIFVAPISSIGYSAAFAPRVEVYTLLACRIHKPGYFPNDPSLDVTTYMADVARIHDIPNANVDVPSNLSIPDATYDHSPSVRDYEWSEKTRERCTTDPEIQAIVAKLSATLVTTMGMLSCLTTGWWGSVCMFPILRSSR